MKSRLQPFGWETFAAYLFDIDGTLLNSRDGVHYNAFHSVLHEFFATDERIDNVPVHGNTDVGILRAVTERAGISDAEFRRKLPQAIAHMQEEAVRNRSDMRPKLCPAVTGLLSFLQQRGARLGVVTGNFEAIAWAKLEAAGLRQYFSFGTFCREDCASRIEIFRAGAAQACALLSATREPNRSPLSPAPNYELRATNYDRAICIVGDTPADIAGARAAGLPIIAVATGIYTYQQLSRERPDLCLSCFADLFPQATGTAG
jgi:phosphoglycolate phosphatase